MRTEALRAVQAPLKDRYRVQPDAALIKLEAAGEPGEGVTWSVRSGRGLVQAGLHPSTGGNGLSLCSGEMQLEALVAYAGVTLNAVATAIGVEIRRGSVHAEGALDVRGTLGVSKDVPVGLQRIQLRVSLETDASDDRLALPEIEPRGGRDADEPASRRAAARGRCTPAHGARRGTGERELPPG